MQNSQEKIDSQSKRKNKGFCLPLTKSKPPMPPVKKPKKEKNS